MNLRRSSVLALCLVLILMAGAMAADGKPPQRLERVVAPKPVYTTLPENTNTNRIIFKLAEGTPRVTVAAKKFQAQSPRWNDLNGILENERISGVDRRVKLDVIVMDDLRQRAMARSGIQLADLVLYHQIELTAEASPAEKLEIVESLNGLDMIEIAYFAPKPELASVSGVDVTPNWQTNQYYLEAAPTGIDAYYAWNYPGGKGEGVKVIDIEGNWTQTHEDLRGGTANFHIAGSRINDPGWWNHGTAVLGEIAADSNAFGMTGIAFNVDLGTVSIGSMSTADAITTATANSDSGDVILIELHAPGPHYNFEDRADQLGYVAMEYWQDNFDAILQASALGRIIVEAAGNGNENFDDTAIYGHLFDPDYRFSGAIVVGASSAAHVPASFTNHGRRVDVHAFGTWDVYTLGYGDLFGSTRENHYTSSFAGTSSASPIITGACAVLQGVHLAAHQRILYHSEMRELLRTYSTPQAAHYKQIGPLPDLRGGIDQIVGVSFTADTTIGWAPLAVDFQASSGLAVDRWTWQFGDGDSADVYNPSHVYDEPGMFDVTVKVEAGPDVRTSSRQNYIKVIADSLTADPVGAVAGTTVEIVLYARNTLPLTSLRIPVEFGGDLELTYDSFSTAGCRTEYFEEQNRAHYSPSYKRMTLDLTSSLAGTSPNLEPGTGPILKLYFTIAGSAAHSQTTTIEFDGYSTYIPEFTGPMLTFTPRTLNAEVNTCPSRGDVDGARGLTISDLVYLAEYMFSAGPDPIPYQSGNVDCQGDVVDIGDIVYLVTYMFGNGPPPPCSDC